MAVRLLYCACLSDVGVNAFFVRRFKVNCKRDASAEKIACGVVAWDTLQSKYLAYKN